MTTETVLSTLRHAGVALWLDGETLRYRAPKGALTDELRQALRQHKAELLVLLQDADPGNDATPQGHVCEPGEALHSMGPLWQCLHCPRVWYAPCPQCGGEDWQNPPTWLCATCGAPWVFQRVAAPTQGAIHPDTTAPDGLYRFTTPDGRQLVSVIYRCPACGGTSWGPQINDPEVWYCLGCSSRHQQG